MNGRFTAEQWAAITALGDVAITAGAGSGKTGVLVERVMTALERGVEPRQVVVVTFTEAAAGELHERLQAAATRRHGGRGHGASVARDVRVGTIHHLCARVAQAHPVLSGAGLAFEMLDDADERLWRRRHLSRVLAELPPGLVTAVPGDVRGAVLAALLDDPTRTVVSLQRTAETADEGDVARAAAVLFTHVQARFEALRAEQGLATFSDLEAWAVRALPHDEVQAYHHARIKQLLVDELQDTSAAQWAILRALVGEHTTLTVVGDGQQGIYGWRGADPHVIAAAQALVRARGGTVVDMHTSFRSSPGVVQTLNGALPVLMPGPAADRPGATPYRPLSAGRTDRDRADVPVELHVVTGGDAVTRPQAVARVLVGGLQAALGTPVLDRGTGGFRAARWADMAMLVRARTQLHHLERALRRAGIPYVLEGGRGLYRRPEVQDAVTLLRALADPTDDRTLLAALRGPYGGWADADLLDLAAARTTGESVWTTLQEGRTAAASGSRGRWRRWRDAAGTLSAAQVLERADQDSGARAVHAAHADGTRRAANLARLDAQLRAWAGEGRRDVRAVARHLHDLLEVDAAAPEAPTPARDAVRVMTVHASKGREFGIVAYADLIMPSRQPPQAVRFDAELGVVVRGRGPAPRRWQAGDARAREQRVSEHERLTYVALTRAADRLILAVAGTPDDRGALGTVLEAFPGAARRTHDAGLVSPPLPLPVVEDRGRLVLPVRAGPGAALPARLPVTAVSDYRHCPQAFSWRHLYGYLPLVPAWHAEPVDPDVRRAGRDIGTAVHRALERGWTARTLPRRWAGLSAADVDEIRGLLDGLDSPAFAGIRSGAWEREVPLQVGYGRVALHGVADAVDRERGIVIDYKTDAVAHPQAHRLQLAVYAAALSATRAGLVYLRHDRVHWLDEGAVRRAQEEVAGVIDRMVALDFAPTPSVGACGVCAFRGVCAQAVTGHGV